MSLGATFLIVVFSIVGAVQAQQLSYDVPPENGTNAAPADPEPPVLLKPYDNLELLGARTNDLVLKDKLNITGPLVSPAKAAGFLDFSRRLLEMVNPFPKAAIPDQRLRVEPEGRAWATVVGWAAGTSAFPDDEHQQGGLRLITFSGVAADQNGP